ncbi:MAG: hypothetical protein COZ34_04330 [Candidatus Pacebacteria bacterium CG_4_10_14_3_um_filter_34_15]|nr:DUF4012 domain-containing protein [Candidatus Pacearchaeota archaeon]NCQ65464.1 DUF4012 domain-containing protein [Candidatus Paceibacterota bacterium]OIO45135.1 MAG: hypothetical protein AUJ41_00740 [Candidatus Pacebacteria bacterium CG1_02_43_31]PIQ81377.1 MAG: hypothetical protein COV78_00590 [Candidatus Pacebacteria bacterium CG11_big_fil_rev_8_21_14_0_20_34_55]PIX81220.1 MAG: hypothetical protein COZ34_04330 [Candidatus Pacebacteria bacterium CG_4_10_14_3_um_filter_34_15]PJC43311.1 MAG
MLNNDATQDTAKLTSFSKVDHVESIEIVKKESFKSKISAYFIKYPKMKPILISIGIFLLLLISVTSVLGFKTYKTINEIKDKASVLQAKSLETYNLFKTQNLPAVQENLYQIDKELAETKDIYSELVFYSYVPFAKNYYNDGLHAFNAAQSSLSAGKKSIDAITPYADVLGFSGEGSFTGGTTEDRLKVILETLDKIAPILDDIANDLKTVESELALINPERYPETLKEFEVRSNILKVQELSSGAVLALTEFRPVIEELPSVAGAGGARKKYLILFQNDNELRPTGGFLTAYAVINVENGKVEAESSNDIYELDQKFTKKIPIPKELGRYLTTEKYWHLRDMNVSPDLKLSMDVFFENYSTVPNEAKEVDGIITVDTHFLTNLMRVLGPVEVPGYGTFSAENDPRCDCPQIIYILSEIITRPTPYLRNDRKGILGPLMRSLLTKAYTAPKQTWPELFQTGFDSIQNRHAQFYFIDEKAQAAAELANVAGRMIPPEDGTDFLAIINANLGGAKSNLFIDYDVVQTVSTPENGMLEKTVEITYRNTHKADNCNLEAGKLCLNSTLRDWTRLYVPEGSELLTSQGFLEDAKTYTENGFTVIDGFFTLEPMATAKLKFVYKVPYADNENYKVAIWKQAGIEQFETLIDVTGGQEKIMVQKDTTYETIF